ncbi:MAG: class II aldolase/adducin family protein [Sphaerochaetaceae bacterium]
MIVSHALQSLIDISRRYGSDARFVLVGGGNTSVKEGRDLYVKASGCALGTIDERGFVRMSLDAMDAIWTRQYPQDTAEREKAVLADMMAARHPGETARPSVEALLHAFIPSTYVVHLHPAMVNGLTCALSGHEAMRALFPDALWIPLVNPGYILAKTVRDALEAYRARRGGFPQVIFLQNHGIFVGSSTIEGIVHIYEAVMDQLATHIVRKPVFTETRPDANRMAVTLKALERFYRGMRILAMANRELDSRLIDQEAFYPISSAYTPDHIVYSGFAPLWIDQQVFSSADPEEAIVGLCRKFEEDHQVKAKVIAVQNTAAFATSENALTLFVDTLKVAAFTESFGGPLFMDRDQIDFIRNWEVESYRAKQAT